MQKKALTYFIVAFFVLSLGALLAIAYHHLHRSPSEIAKVIHATHPVVVVDFNNNGIVSQEELLSGKDAILAISSHQKPQMKVRLSKFFIISLL